MQVNRYEPRTDDDGRWSVIDTKAGFPAVVQNKPLAALDEGKAKDAASFLNMIERMQTQQPVRSPATASLLNPLLLPVR